MRLLVLPHDLGVGGSQRNAIDLACEFRKRGDAVMVAGPRGVLGADIVAAGLEYEPMWVGRLRPSPRRARRVRSLIAEFQPDVVHAYEWPSALEAYAALRSTPNVGLVTTVMSMAVDLEVPRTVPLLVGTPALQAQWAARWRAPVGLCEPPVDLNADAFDLRAGRRFRRELGLDDAAFVAVIVSRLARRMKYDGVANAVRAMAQLPKGRSVHLVIVGDGDAADDVRALAAEVNATTLRTTVHVVGELLDPRPAYDAADVVLGMGGSALRAMAHARPTIVLGERGFVRLVEPSSLSGFVEHGFFGIGVGNEAGERAIHQLLSGLASAPDRCGTLGRFGYEVVRDRYALNRVAAGLATTYDAVRADGTDWRWTEALRAHRAAIGRELRFHLPGAGQPAGVPQVRAREGIAA